MNDDSAPARVQWIALSLLPRVGSKTLAALLAHFGSLDAIFTASESDLRAVARIGPHLAAAIRAIDLNRTRAEIVCWQADGIKSLLRTDEGYPLALRALDDAPPVLFWRGLSSTASERAVAIVGTRHPSTASRQFAGTLAEALAARGWTVVSGLASGIDAATHRGAIAAGGRTLAVLGSGVRAIYPPENATLAGQIAAQGVLLSEVHPDAAPNSAALVARNRIISGLSRAVIVVEAGPASGSLHAARFARAQQRPVYAVENGSAGNQHLIEGDACPLPLDLTDWDQLSDTLAAGDGRE